MRVRDASGLQPVVPIILRSEMNQRKTLTNVVLIDSLLRRNLSSRLRLQPQDSFIDPADLREDATRSAPACQHRHKLLAPLLIERRGVQLVRLDRLKLALYNSNEHFNNNACLRAIQRL